MIYFSNLKIKTAKCEKLRQSPPCKFYFFNFGRETLSFQLNALWPSQASLEKEVSNIKKK